MITKINLYFRRAPSGARCVNTVSAHDPDIEATISDGDFVSSNGTASILARLLDYPEDEVKVEVAVSTGVITGGHHLELYMRGHNAQYLVVGFAGPRLLWFCRSGLRDVFGETPVHIWFKKL